MSRDQKLNVEAAASVSGVPWILDFEECMCTVAGASRDTCAALQNSLTQASISSRWSMSVTNSVTCRAAVRPQGQWGSAKGRLSCMKATFKQQLIPNSRQFKGGVQLVVFWPSLLLKNTICFLSAESCLQCSLFCPIQQFDRHSSLAWICHHCSRLLFTDLRCRKCTKQKGPAHKITELLPLFCGRSRSWERATLA